MKRSTLGDGVGCRAAGVAASAARAGRAARAERRRRSGSVARSISMRITPSAWRRSANGSLSPVGSWPMPNRPTSVSSLSASATTTPTAIARQRVAGEARLVVVLDRDARPRRARRRGARSSRPSRPAARGTRRPCRSAGRPWRAARRGRPGAPASAPPSCSPIAARDRAHALARARPACRACRGRPPCRAPARATRACFLRSWSKKNLASARRGRTTRSLPSIDARRVGRRGCC